MHSIRRLIPALGALALAACSSEPTVTAATATGTHAAASVAASGNGKYILNAGPQGFSPSLGDDIAALGGTIESVHGEAGIAVVSGISNPGALGALNGVREVQGDEEFSLDLPAGSTMDADANAIGDVTIESVSNPAAAPRYSWQWNMRDIEAQYAWAAGKLGDAGVTVSIIDTGIDYDNPDLNGLVDLSRSASFVASDNATRAHYFPTRNDISDFNGHGTNVAAQVSSKAAVHAGVGSKTKLIGVKVLSASGSGTLSAVLNGVLWSADHGADVANMSLGGGFSKAGNGRFTSLINKVFNYANRKGMLIVVAAGNDAADLDHDGNFNSTYCNQSHVICVSAVGPVVSSGSPDLSSYYTNFGRSAISVAGPGGNGGVAYSAWPWGTDAYSWVWSYCSKTRLAGFTGAGVPVLAGCQAGNRVTGYIGTSQATPHVAGLAGLLVAEMGHGQPSKIRAAIEKSAADLGQPGTDPQFGRGRISVRRALGL
ncbi:MAG: peptidase in kexin sedolisin [Gemmatimonadetes bacterium]|nr:peptidase in kexin sedolisin [Gemmatimonadota bacterium]